MRHGTVKRRERVQRRLLRTTTTDEAGACDPIQSEPVCSRGKVMVSGEKEKGGKARWSVPETGSMCRCGVVGFVCPPLDILAEVLPHARRKVVDLRVRACG